MTGEFPASLEQIDSAWLTQVMRQSGALADGVIVADFGVKPIGSGFGQTGEPVRLLFDYGGGEAQGPRSAFVKFATSDPVRRQASQRLDLFRREVYFYNELASQANVPAPRCYFAQASAAGDFATLLLEDFPDHRPGDDLVGLQADEAELAVDLLAKLHAPFWGRGNELGVAPLSMGNREQFDRAWDVVETSFGDQMPAAVRSFRTRYLDAIEPLHQWLLAQPATLGHGDLKLDNILFGPGTDAPIVAVDWQAVRPQKGMRDFAYLVSHSMNVDDRRAHEQRLMQRYLDALRSHGVGYSQAEAEEDYRLSMLFDFCTVLFIAGVNINTNERANLRKRALIERATTALLDWDAFARLDRFV